MVPNSLAEGFDVQMEPAVLLFTAAAGLLTSLIAGIGPALRSMQQRGLLQLHETGRSNTASIEKQRLRSAFVVSEVALAFVLLTGTGLFLANLRQLQQVNPGFDARDVLAGELFFSGEGYKESLARQTALVDAVIDNLSEQQGVKSVAALDPLPFTERSDSGSFEIQGRPAAKNDPGPHSQLSSAAGNLLQVLQIPLLAGRWFTSGDRATTQPVVVIDTRLAQRYWPGRSPLGQHVRMGEHEAWSTVIGVVGNIRSNSLEEDTSDGRRYYPYSQSSNMAADFSRVYERTARTVRGCHAASNFVCRPYTDPFGRSEHEYVDCELAGWTPTDRLDAGGVRRARSVTRRRRHLWID